MVNAVRKADFVVVNPDHIAVAIQYDKDGNAAPIVLAKGERLLAEKIKEVAREAGVPIFRDVSLARALRDVEEGDEIPEALYEAVAEILRVVYGDQPAARAPAAAAAAPGRARAAAGPAGGLAPSMNLLEVALALPPFATYTYRDPRRGRGCRWGPRWWCRCGGRRVTGFVVGHPDTRPRGCPAGRSEGDRGRARGRAGPRSRRSWSCAAGRPAYYLAPLGEVLRAALPQGERAAAARRVRLTEDGQAVPEARPGGQGRAARAGAGRGRSRAARGGWPAAPAWACAGWPAPPTSAGWSA